MKSLKKWLGYLFSFCSLVLALYMDFQFFKETKGGNEPAEIEWFLFGFLSFILLLMISAPFIKGKIANNKKLLSILSIPSVEDPITYLTVTSFLSEQALGSFLITITIFIARDIKSDFTPLISGFFTAPAFIICILIVSISLIRLLVSLGRYPFWIYSALSIFAFSISFKLFGIGIKLAT